MRKGRFSEEQIIKIMKEKGSRSKAGGCLPPPRQPWGEPHPGMVAGGTTDDRRPAFGASAG
jgi:hypothetical protein